MKELLHIDEKQFKQIAMIAQGEFRDLLFAKTEQRTEILRTIFMTENYKNIEYRLKDRLDASSKERVRTENSIVQYFGDVAAPEGSDLAEELGEPQTKAGASGSAWNVDEFVDVIGRIIAADEVSSEAAAEQIKGEEQVLDGIKGKLATAEINNGFITRRDALKKEQSTLAAQRLDMEALSQKLARQKTASYNVAPAFEAWTSKCEDKTAAEEAITASHEQLTGLEEDAAKAGQTLIEAEAKRPQAEALTREAEAIARQEQDYIRRDKLRTEIRRLEGRSEALKEKESEITEIFP